MQKENTYSAPECGAAETAFFSDVKTALAAAAPQYSTVRQVGFDSDDIFNGAGYRTVTGEADIAIARGGEAEFGKAREFPFRKLILVPTHDYAAAASEKYTVRDGGFSVIKTGQKPFAAVFDNGIVHNNLASVFGEIFALDLCAFDLAFGAHMRGERSPYALCAEVARLVTELTAELKGNEKDIPAASASLVNAGRRAARLIERNPALLHASGAAQAAEAVRMLCSAEERQPRLRGETEAALVPYVTEFYIKTLTTDSFDFPPNNAKRIDAVCEYFGADIRRATVYASPVYPPIKMRLCEYRRDEFRSELLKMLYEIKQRRIAAWKVFKRLYKDDGYSIPAIADKSDICICLALAPDVFSADTMLSFIKQTGRLERYIA